MRLRFDLGIWCVRAIVEGIDWNVAGSGEAETHGETLLIVVVVVVVVVDMMKWGFKKRDSKGKGGRR